MAALHLLTHSSPAVQRLTWAILPSLRHLYMINVVSVMSAFTMIESTLVHLRRSQQLPYRQLLPPQQLPQLPQQLQLQLPAGLPPQPPQQLQRRCRLPRLLLPLPQPRQLLLPQLRSRYQGQLASVQTCLLYTSDAADERSSVDLGGRRI